MPTAGRSGSSKPSFTVWSFTTSPGTTTWRPMFYPSLGSKRSIVPPGMFVQALNSPTVKVEEEPPTKPDLVPAIGQQVLTLDTDWRSPIIDFIKNNKSYPKGKEHEKLARRSSNYVVIGTELFKHSASSGTLCKCVTQDEGVRILSDIHSGICGNHASTGPRPWPTPETSSGDVPGASSSPSSSTSRLRPCGLSLHPGHSPVGDST